MKFVYPEFLYALLALLIPVIVHLFNFRRFKKIKFSNVKFLEEVQLETQSKSRLKHLLVLFSRLLALASLVLAFCLPYFPVADSQVMAGRKAISIYIDNSFSMNGQNEQGLLVEQAKELARNVAKSYAESDRFQLLTNDFEGRHQRTVSREEFLEFVDEVSPSAKVKNLSQVVERMKEALSRETIDNKRGFILSDFQKSISDFEEIKSDSNYYFSLIRLQQENIGNVYIDSIWFATPVRQLNGNDELIVKITNQSDSEKNNLNIKVSINDVQKALASVDIPSNSSVTTSMYFTNDSPGIMQGMVSITDYPITFDDVFYFSFDVKKKINVLAVGTGSSSIASVFEEDEMYSFSHQSINGVDYSRFVDQDLIILDEVEKISSGLNQELKKFVENGGTVCVMLGEVLDKSSYNEFMLNMNANRINRLEVKETKVIDINLENYFYDGVFAQMPKNIDLPTVKKHWRFNTQSRSREEVLLSLQNGSSFLSQFPVGSGQLFVFSVGTSDAMSNLTKHAIFVTSILRVAELSNGHQSLFQTIGKDEAIKIRTTEPNSDEPFHIKKDHGIFDVIPSFQNYGSGIEVFVHEQIQQDGLYRIQMKEEDVTGLAFNYSREESEMKFLNKEQLQEIVQSSALENFQIVDVNKGGGESIQSLSEGTKLWKWFVLGAILFLLVEVLLLRFL